MMRVRIGEFVAAVCVVAWGVARVWAAPGAIGARSNVKPPPGSLVQHPPPPPCPGWHYATTSRKPTHSNVKGSGLNKPPQNPGLDRPCKRRCTRYVALHPLRGATPDQKGCTAYGSGARPITRTNAESARRSPTRRQHAGGQLLMLQTSTAQFKTVAQGANLDGPIGECTGRPGRGCRGCRETGK